MKRTFELHRYVVWSRNLMAAIGVLSLLVLAYVYYQGRAGLERADPAALEVMGLLAQRTLETDMASATVLRIPVTEGVSLKDVSVAMKARAKALGIRLVDRHRIRKAIDKKDEWQYVHVEVYEFCDKEAAGELLDYNPDFAVYMPCRVVMIQDRAGNAWLATIDLNLLVYGGREMDQGAKDAALQIKEGLLDIMTAGAAGTP